MMVSINLEDEKLAKLNSVFGRQTGTLPFTYSGLPLVTSKTHIQDFLSLITTQKSKQSVGQVQETLPVERLIYEFKEASQSSLAHVVSTKEARRITCG